MFVEHALHTAYYIALVEGKYDTAARETYAMHTRCACVFHLNFVYTVYTVHGGAALFHTIDLGILRLVFIVIIFNFQLFLFNFFGLLSFCFVVSKTQTGISKSANFAARFAHRERERENVVDLGGPSRSKQ